LALKIGLEASIRFCVGHPLKRQSMLNVLCQQIQGHCCNSKRGIQEGQPVLEALVPVVVVRSTVAGRPAAPQG
jgi:hypothetical protein